MANAGCVMKVDVLFAAEDKYFDMFKCVNVNILRKSCIVLLVKLLKLL